MSLFIASFTIIIVVNRIEHLSCLVTKYIYTPFGEYIRSTFIIQIIFGSNAYFPQIVKIC